VEFYDRSWYSETFVDFNEKQFTLLFRDIFRFGTFTGAATDTRESGMIAGVESHTRPIREWGFESQVFPFHTKECAQRPSADDMLKGEQQEAANCFSSECGANS
jgi:hypothetical protein